VRAPCLPVLPVCSARVARADRTRRSSRCVLGSLGFLADAATLQKHLHAKQVMYELNHGKPMSCPAMAQARVSAALLLRAHSSDSY
jgi:hypothetical protein